MYDYIQHIKRLIETVEEKEGQAIDQTVELIEKTIRQKRAVYIFGASHAGILTQEMYYRAGGLMPINPIFAKELSLDREPVTTTSQMERLIGYGTILANSVDFHADDILLLHSVSGRNPVIIDLALAAKAKGVKIIGLTNVSYSTATGSRHPSGKRLFEVADIVLDNHGDIGDASCEIKGISQKVGPTSTVIGAMLLNMIVVEVARKLVANGVSQPPIFYSANLDGGDALNQTLSEEYKDVIKYRM